MRAKHTMDLTNGPVFKQFVVFSLPILANALLQQLYAAADTVVVGKFATPTALAAVGAMGSLIGLLIGLFNGLSIAANILCANYFGARKQKELQRCMHSSIVLSAISGIGMGIVGFALARPLLQLMSCPENVIDQSVLYMKIYFCGVPASMIFNFSASILRAHGDTKRPMVILTITGVVNVLLNLVFVIVFHLDVAGVALATIISQYISAIVLIIILFSPKDEYGMKVKALRLDTKDLKALVSKGVPTGLNGITFSVANVILQSTINSFGDITIAGYAASASLIGFIAQISASFYTGCVSFSGQCFGAKKYDRIDRLIVSSIICGTVGISLMCLVLTTMPDFWLGLYTNSDAVREAGRDYLMVVGWSYLLYNITDTATGCLRGMGQSVGPTVLNVGGICLSRLAWIFFIFPLNPVPSMLFMCYPVSYVLSATAQMIYFLWCRKHIRKDMQTETVEAL